MPILETFSPLGMGGIARFAGCKQVWEIQILPGSPPMQPIYLRRRVTYVSLQFELNYTAAVPMDASSAYAFIANVCVQPGGLDYLDKIRWVEAGPNQPTREISPFDNDGQGNPTSGKWVGDGKELIGLTDNSVTAIATWRNEGEWIFDYDRASP